MARIVKQISFRNAVINTDDGTITEYLKDETKSYKLDAVLNDWNNIEGISFTLKQEDESTPDGE